MTTTHDPRTRLVATVVFAVLALTACGGSDTPTRTDEPVITAPSAGSPTSAPTAAPATPSDGAVVASEVVAAAGQDRKQSTVCSVGGGATGRAPGCPQSGRASPPAGLLGSVGVRVHHDLRRL